MGQRKGKLGLKTPMMSSDPHTPCGSPSLWASLCMGRGMLHPALIQPVPTPATKGTHTKGSLGGLAPKMS